MRICIYADNSCNYVRTLLSIWENGDCAVLIDPRIPLKSALEQMMLCNVVKCYTDYNFDEISDLYSNDFAIQFITIEKEEMKFFDNKLEYPLFSKENLDREALILFSSGTTGKSKGVIHSYYNIQKNAEMIIEYMRPLADDRIFIVKSLAHSSTVVGELLVALKTNTSFMLGKTTQHMGSLWKSIISNKITILCLNPTLLHMLCQYLLHIVPDISSCNVKKIYTSGAVLNKEDVEQIKLILNFTKIFNVYGLTEAGPRVSAQIEEEPLGSVGKPIGDVKVIVTDEKGKPLQAGQKGIINVNTRCLFRGYVSSDSVEREAVYNDWLNTGDIGYFDSHDNLYVIGRRDRMVICGGHNVYPEYIEAIIMKLNGIKDCYVYGIKDDIWGEKLVCTYDSNVELNRELFFHCKKYLAQYEIPKTFIKGTIYKTPNGKKRINNLFE